MRIDWKYALNLELSHPGFDFSVLCEFRARLLGGHAEQLLFETMLDQFKTHGLRDPRVGTNAPQDPYPGRHSHSQPLGMRGETMRHALEALAVVVPAWLLQHVRAIRGRSAMSSAFRSIGCLKVEADRQALAETIGTDGFTLMAALADPATPAWLREVPALEILRRVWIQQFYAPAGQVQWHSTEDLPPAALLIQSPYDVEAALRCQAHHDLDRLQGASHGNL